MKTMNSMSLHDIKKVEIRTVRVDSESGAAPFTVNKYQFIDADGNKFTVTAFMEGEEK